MSFNQEQFICGFRHLTVTNSLQEPDSIMPVLVDGSQPMPLTSVAWIVGSRPLFITAINAVFNDIAVDDPAPAVDTYLGWSVRTASDGTATPTYAEVVGYTANADLPHILEDATPTAILGVANIPYNLFSWVGGVASTPLTSEPDVVKGRQAPIRIAADTLLQVRVGLYTGGALTAVTGLTELAIMVHGFYV
ncbi:hypothetical protein LCGC14_2235360 [marine sediment metagenome]|uniref:Uncharacterized protein n=1 Tax=marine sediment metagenome TaxID=412755 RepID=A0A0F9G219_9ZZZZ